jgi:hypothetical protein
MIGALFIGKRFFVNITQHDSAYDRHMQQDFFLEKQLNMYNMYEELPNK